MKDETRTIVELGDLIEAVFDAAAQHSGDPREISRLATQAVAQVLWRHISNQARQRPAHGMN